MQKKEIFSVARVITACRMLTQLILKGVLNLCAVIQIRDAVCMHKSAGIICVSWLKSKQIL